MEAGQILANVPTLVGGVVPSVETDPMKYTSLLRFPRHIVDINTHLLYACFSGSGVETFPWLFNVFS